MRRQTRASREYQRVKDLMRFDNATLANMRTDNGKAWFLVPQFWTRSERGRRPTDYW